MDMDNRDDGRAGKRLWICQIGMMGVDDIERAKYIGNQDPHDLNQYLKIQLYSCLV